MKTVKHHEEENFVAQFINRYLPYWPMFLIFLFLCMGAAWFYLYVTNPLYESNAHILIKDERKGAEDSKALDELNLLSTKKIIENEMEVIQSRTLLEQVVNELGLRVSVMEETKFKKFSAFYTSPIRVEGSFIKNAKIPEKNYFTCDRDMNVTMNGNTYELNKWYDLPYGNIRFLRNKNFSGVMPVNKQYFQVADAKVVVAFIQNRLKVTTDNKQSSILTLSMQDEVPKRAEDILNGLMEMYTKAMVTDKNLLAANTLASVEARLKTVEHELDAIETKSQKYKSNRGVVDISEQGKLFLQNVSTNDQKMSEVSTQLAVLDQVEQYVRGKKEVEGVVPSTAGISDPVLPSLIDKLYTLELERETLKKTAGENNFAMTSITDKIDRIRPGILENIGNQRKSLQATANNIASTNKTYSSQLETMPEKERDLIEINRELGIKNNIYTFLLQKREETALTHAAAISDSRIIDAAQSGTLPVSPKSKVIYFSAFLLAIILGVGVVAIRETLSRRIKFREDIHRLSSLPIIGEIGTHASRTPVVAGNQEKTFIAEQFRKLRLSLKFIGIKGSKNKIMVTSAISGEGKSFVSLNLALTLALTGKKVVLIDADLNNPSLHKKLKTAQVEGLSQYLAEEVDDMDVIIKQTETNENLYFISAGELTENPSELLLSNRLETLINDLSTKYDYVLVDTAPVGLVTGAYLVSPFCDATIFVVRHNYTPKSVVQHMDEENKINELTNIGIVFNDVHARGFGSNKYGYGYGSGYIYNDKNYHRLSPSS